MSKKDILEIKIDLGLCVDILTAMFFYLCINQKLGIICFVLSVTIESILYVYNLYKLKRGVDNE